MLPNPRELANRAFIEGRLQDALDSYTLALNQNNDDPALFCNRSLVNLKLNKTTDALKDAEQALLIGDQWHTAHVRKAQALQALGRFSDAADSFDRALFLLPSDSPDRSELERQSNQCRRSALDSKRVSNVELEDLECALCMRIFFEPVTLFCGHSYCRPCLSRAVDHDPKCPLCRAPVHCNVSQAPIAVALASIVQRCFPDEYAERRKEAQEEMQPNASSMPMFVLPAVAFPQCSFGLHVFEPRYRLMIRRILSTNRLFAIVFLDPQTNSPASVATCVQITDSTALPDGRFLIQTIGLYRVSVLNYWEVDGYLVGRVEPKGEEQPPSNPQQSQKSLETANNLYQAVINLSTSLKGPTATTGSRALAERLSSISPPPPNASHSDIVSFSYKLADILPIEAINKQKLVCFFSFFQPTNSTNKLAD